MYADNTLSIVHTTKAIIDNSKNYVHLNVIHFDNRYLYALIIHVPKIKWQHVY